MGYYKIHLKDYSKSCEKLLWDIMIFIWRTTANLVRSYYGILWNSFEGLQEILWEIMGYYESHWRTTGNLMGGYYGILWKDYRKSCGKFIVGIWVPFDVPNSVVQNSLIPRPIQNGLGMRLRSWHHMMYNFCQLPKHRKIWVHFEIDIFYWVSIFVQPWAGNCYNLKVISCK